MSSRSVGPAELVRAHSVPESVADQLSTGGSGAGSTAEAQTGRHEAQAGRHPEAQAGRGGSPRM